MAGAGCKKLDKNWAEGFIDWRVVVRLEGGRKKNTGEW